VTTGGGLPATSAKWCESQRPIERSGRSSGASLARCEPWQGREFHCTTARGELHGGGGFRLGKIQTMAFRASRASPMLADAKENCREEPRPI